MLQCVYLVVVECSNGVSTELCPVRSSHYRVYAIGFAIFRTLTLS